MTREYATSMWDRYLTAMKNESKESIFENPVYLAVVESRYENLSPEEQSDLIDESSIHFQDKRKATVNTLILRALGEIMKKEKGSESLVSMLASISASSYDQQP